jgi:Excalibur calcium-binding domain
MRRVGMILMATAVALCGFSGLASAAQDAGAIRYPNCKALNKRYPHGVGRWGAHDRTRSGDPVTNFKRSNRLYRQNSHLDRDNDKIACEKK